MTGSTTGPAEAGDRPDLRAGAIVERGNELLVVRHSAVASPERRGEGRWSVPTAAVRRGETLVEAATRSVRGGCGLDALAGPFVGWYESIGVEPSAAGGHAVVACFTVVVLDDSEPEPAPGLSEARWMPVWDVAELPLVDGLAELLSTQGVIDTLT